MAEKIMPDLMPALMQRQMPYIIPYNSLKNYNAPPAQKAGTGLLFDYNDPNEVNSMADVIMNSKANPWNVLTGGIDLFKRGTIDPIRAGQWGVAGLNNLMNFAETMDIVAAPTKALLQGHGFEGAKAALGYGVEGRQNYDWDTGNIVGDFVLEVVSDPINWITLGVKGVVTSAAKGMVKAGIEATAKDAAIEMSDKIYKKMAKQTVDSFLKGDTENFMKTTEELMQFLEDTGKLKFTDKNPITNAKDFAVALSKAEKITKEGMGFTITRSVSQLVGYTEQLEKVMLKTALSPSIYPEWWLAKKGFDKGYKMIDRRMNKQLQQYTRADGMISFSDLDRVIAATKESQTAFELMQQVKGQAAQDVPRNVLYMIREGVRNDTNAINSIFINNGDKLDQIKAEINDYMKKYNKVETLEEYIKVLQDINAKTDGAFEDSQIIYERFLKRLSDTETGNAHVQEEKYFRTKAEQLNQFQVKLTEKFDPSEYNQIKEELKQLQIETKRRKKYNLTEADLERREYLSAIEMEQRSTYIKNSFQQHLLRNFYNITHPKAYELGEITQNKMRGLGATLYIHVMQPYIAEMKASLDELMLGVPPEAAFDFARIVGLDFNKWKKQLNRAYGAFLEANRINHNSGATLMKDFEMPNALDTFSDTLRMIDGLREATMKRVDGIAKVTKTYDMDSPLYDLMPNNENVKQVTQHAAKITQDTELLISRGQKEGKEVLDHEQLEAVYGVKKRLQKLYEIPEKGSMVDIMSALDRAAESDSLEISETFSEALNKFLATEPNTDEFTDAYSTLQRFLREQEGKLSESLRTLTPDGAYVNPTGSKTVNIKDTYRRAEFVSDASGIKNEVIWTEQTKFENELYQEITKILDELDTIRPVNVQDAMLSTADKAVLTKLKTEGVNVMLDLSVRGKIGDTLRAIKNKDSAFGKFINKYLEMEDAKGPVESETTSHIIEIAKELNYIADLNAPQVEFFNRIAAIPTDVPIELKMAVLSTLQNYSSRSPEKMMNFVDERDEFFDAVQTHLVSTYSNEVRNMDFARETIDDWGKEIPEDVRQNLVSGVKAHTAEGDADLLRLWLNVEHPEIIKKYQDTYTMVADIEAAGTNPATSPILELAYVTADGSNKYSMQVKYLYDELETYMPDDDVLKTLFSQYSTRAERRQAFRDKYVTDSPAAVVTERNLLEDWILHTPKPFTQANPFSSNTFIFHYGQKYDYRVINERLRQHGLREYAQAYMGATHADSYLDMLTKDDRLVVKDIAREKIEPLLYDLAVQMFGHSSGKLLDSRATELLRYMKELSSTLNELMASVNRDITLHTELQIVREDIEDTAQAIQDILSEVGGRNSAYANFSFRNIFSQSTPESRQAFISNYVKDHNLQNAADQITEADVRLKYGFNAETVFEYSKLLGISPEEVHAMYGDNLSFARVLRDKNPIGQVATKNTLNRDFIDRFFDLSGTPELSIVTQEKLSRIGKYINKDLSYLKNPYAIHEVAQHLPETLSKLVDSGLGYYRAVRKDIPDVLTQFMTIKYLYNAYAKADAEKIVEKARLKIAEIGKDYSRAAELSEMKAVLKRWTLPDGKTPWNPDIPVALRELLEDPTGIYKSTLYGRSICTSETLGRRARTDLASQPVMFAQYADELVNQNINLEKFARSLDNDLYASGVYVAVNAQKPMVRILQRLKTLAPRDLILHMELEHTIRNRMGTMQVATLLDKSIKDPRHLLSTLVWSNFFTQFSKIQSGDDVAFRKLLSAFMEKQKDFESLGIKIHESSNRIYIYLDLAHNKIDAGSVKLEYKKHKEYRTLNGVEVPRPEHSELSFGNELEEGYLQDYLKTQKNLELLSKGNSVGTTGELITPSKMLEYFYKLPKEVQAGLGELSYMTNEKFWSGVYFDWMNIGTIESKQYVDKYAYKTLSQAYDNSLRLTAALAESKAQYLSLYFDSQTGINSGLLGAADSDNDIIAALKNNDEFVLAALVVDNSKAGDGYRVVQLRAETAEDMANARRLNATILPYQVFATSHQTLNTTQFSSQFLNLWHKIIYTYKVGFLADPGVFLRNYIDSTMKNMVSADANVARVAHTQIRAMKLLNHYNKALTNILKTDKGVFNYENVAKYFELYNQDPNFTVDQFKYLHGFIIYSASAGLTGPWQKYLKDKNIKVEDKNLWSTFVSASDALMLPNKYIEQINRLTDYMMLEEDGNTKTKIFKEIAKTHFDYNIKTRSEMYAELIFPFYTFTMRNLEFWINALLTRPWLADMFRDIMTPVWNFDGYDYDELDRNRSLQYQLLQGNIPLHMGPLDGTTLKVNPSYMDVYNILMDIPESIIGLTNPEDQERIHFNAIRSKINPPMQVVLDHTLELQGGLAAGLFDTSTDSTTGQDSLWNTVLNNLPLVGAPKVRYDQGPKYAERSGQAWQTFPLTQGTFGATQRWQAYPQKAPKFYSKYAKNTYTKKYYNYDKNTRSYPRDYYPSNRFQFDEYESFYKKHYSKTGKSKFKMRMIPLSAGNLQYRIKDMYWYFR